MNTSAFRKSQRSILAITGLAFVFTALHSTQTFAQQNRGTTHAGITYQRGIQVTRPDQTTLRDGRIIFYKADRMPEYAGNVQEFLSTNLQYPETARKSRAEGRTIVRFIVNADGSVSDAEIVQSSGNPLLDEESLRVVQMMSGWQPGVKDGVAVPVYFNLPITFKLD